MVGAVVSWVKEDCKEIGGSLWYNTWRKNLHCSKSVIVEGSTVVILVMLYNLLRRILERELSSSEAIAAG